MSDKDNITLPRKVVEKALEALGEETAWFGPTPKGAAAITALRTALAAPKQEPVAWLSRDEARLALWKAINSREFGNPTDDKLILDHLRQQGLWIGKVTSPALAAEQPRHPGYIIGNHWFETAYERLCAGEAEDAILEDYELVREPRLRDLRRDAERYRWLRDKAPPDIGDMASVRDSHDPSEIDAAIDAAMEEKR